MWNLILSNLQSSNEPNARRVISIQFEIAGLDLTTRIEIAIMCPFQKIKKRLIECFGDILLIDNALISDCQSRFY